MIFNFNQGETIDLSDATATADDVLSGKTFYSGNKEIKTGTLKADKLISTVTTLHTDIINWLENSNKAKMFTIDRQEFYVQRPVNTITSQLQIRINGDNTSLNSTANFMQVFVNGGSEYVDSCYSKIEFYGA